MPSAEEQDTRIHQLESEVKMLHMTLRVRANPNRDRLFSLRA